MSYIDGFVVAVPTANRQAYLEHAGKASALFREFGASRVVECWGDDVPGGKLTDFMRAVQARDDEVVVFGWFEFPSREARDQVHEKMSSDPRMAELPEMPFDGKRMIFGGFTPIVDTGAGTPGSYADGFILAVRDSRRAEYIEIAEDASKVFLDHGALRVVEAWEDDVPGGTLTDMRRAVQAVEGEKIVLSWIEWPSKAIRDTGMKQVMDDPRMKMDPEAMPFDGKRLIYGGFEVLLEG